MSKNFNTPQSVRGIKKIEFAAGSNQKDIVGDGSDHKSRGGQGHGGKDQ
jgi:hypothetical protein